MDNLKVTCNLATPISGNSFMLDSILMYRVAMNLGLEKLDRNTKLNEVKLPEIPIEKFTFRNEYFYKVSNPIFKIRNVERKSYTKRFPTEKTNLLKEKYHKNIMTASGLYKSHMKPMDLFSVDKIVWFAKGIKPEIEDIVKDIDSIGGKRNIGNGVVTSWNVETIEDDYSISATHNNQRILMRVIPFELKDQFCDTGYSISYGSHRPPYWHPDNYNEIAIPI